MTTIHKFTVTILILFSLVFGYHTIPHLIFEGQFPFREKQLNLKIQKVEKEQDIKFRSNCPIIELSNKDARISYLKEDIWIEAFIRS